MLLEKEIKISFIIPIYNAEEYLKECIDSILNQDYKNIEIVLVNDGSKDGSGKICDEYSEKYEFIKTIHKENGGVSSTRNAGLKAATGDYIFFMDNDDWLAENILGKVVDIIKKTNVDLIINRYYIYEDGKTSVGNKFIEKEFIDNKSTEDVLNYFRSKRINIMAPWEYIVKRNIVIDNNISFNPAQNGVDDSVFSPSLFCNCKSFYLNEEPVYFWRQRQTSQGRTHKKQEFMFKMLSTIESLSSFLNTINEDYKKNYIYFSIHKNLFSLFGYYYDYSLEDRGRLKKYLKENKKMIKESLLRAGLLHRFFCGVFGLFLGLLLSHKLATFKGKLFNIIYKTKNINS